MKIMSSTGWTKQKRSFLWVTIVSWVPRSSVMRSSFVRGADGWFWAFFLPTALAIWNTLCRFQKVTGWGSLSFVEAFYGETCQIVIRLVKRQSRLRVHFQQRQVCDGLRCMGCLPGWLWIVDHPLRNKLRSVPQDLLVRHPMPLPAGRHFVTARP